MGLKLQRNVGALMVPWMELSRLALDVMDTREICFYSYEDASLQGGEGVV